ncbi:hypothetical protein AWRI3579_g715 [Hanseniaspora osmophila]|mgnify:CR=1 FL=1|uniref:Uncharacterized protein n=1 Tax=Hanseniaspora osmophila TaxID=56408 RepID=A0A1E5RN27_9ASCO|nr:hypothetical protein AWRI3579_g715 [Hanseniaspora osmophila]
MPDEIQKKPRTTVQTENSDFFSNKTLHQTLKYIWINYQEMRNSKTLWAAIKQTSTRDSSIQPPVFINNTLVNKSRLYTCVNQIASGSATINPDFCTESRLRQLTKQESTVFQWYFHSKGIPKLLEDRTYKIYMKKKWFSLSDNMKTLYYYDYFTKCLRIDYHILSTYKFARLLEWEIPPTSPYIMFRQHFKTSYAQRMDSRSELGIMKSLSTPKKFCGVDKNKITTKQYLNNRTQTRKFPLVETVMKYDNTKRNKYSRSDLYRACKKSWEEKISGDHKKALEKRLLEKYNLLSLKVQQEISKMDRLIWRSVS